MGDIMNNIYNLYIKETNNFKTASLEVVFKLSFNKYNITKLNIIKNIIINNYKTKKLLKEKYDTKIYGVVNKIGNTLLLEINLDYIDPKYSEDYIDKIYKIFFDSIFNPEITKEMLEVSKKFLLEEIDSINLNSMDKSILEALKYYNSDAPYSCNLSGDIEYLNKINVHNIKEFYKKLINKSHKNIYVISSENKNKVERIIQKYALFNSIVKDLDNYYLDYLPIKRTKKNIINIDDIGTNLVMIYTFNKLSKYEERYVMPLFNIIWGGSLISSKLYKALRENNAICYNVNSIYQKYDRMIIVYVSLSKENLEKAIKLIKTTFKTLKKSLTKEDLVEAKKVMTNSLILTKDNLLKSLNNMIFESFNLIDSVDMQMEEYNKVTLEDIYSLIKKIKLLSINKVGE